MTLYNRRLKKHRRFLNTKGPYSKHLSKESKEYFKNKKFLDYICLIPIEQRDTTNVKGFISNVESTNYAKYRPNFVEPTEPYPENVK